MSQKITAVRTVHEGYYIYAPDDLRDMGFTQDALVGDRWCERVCRFGSCVFGHWHPQDKNSPDVLCGQCGNDAFKLNYGEYKIDAACAECGFSDTVYDG